MNRVTEIGKRIRRDALSLIAVGVVLGFLIGLGVGLFVGYNQGNRITVIPLTRGIEV